jgi:hypothetical protein
MGLIFGFGSPCNMLPNIVRFKRSCSGLGKGQGGLVVGLCGSL